MRLIYQELKEIRETHTRSAPPRTFHCGRVVGRNSPLQSGRAGRESPPDTDTQTRLLYPHMSLR